MKRPEHCYVTSPDQLSYYRSISHSLYTLLHSAKFCCKSVGLKVGEESCVLLLTEWYCIITYTITVTPPHVQNST